MKATNIILVPQYPVDNRYSGWYFYLFPKMFKKYFDSVRILTPFNFYRLRDDEFDSSSFSPVDKSIAFELGQIESYMSISEKELNSSILFFCDISFPGIFANILFHRKPKHAFALCHGTSRNKYDYFAKNRSAKFSCETGLSKLFDKIFVATNYHKEKLGWKNCEVVGLPFLNLANKYHIDCKRTIDVIAPCRTTIQKTSKNYEIYLYQKMGIKVVHKVSVDYEKYYGLLSKSKILLSTAKEETFGYQILDGIANGCIPIAPKSLSYPELLPDDYLFTDKNDLVNKINRALSGDLKCPYNVLKRYDVDLFFERISKIMLGYK